MKKINALNQQISDLRAETQSTGKDNTDVGAELRQQIAQLQGEKDAARRVSFEGGGKALAKFITSLPTEHQKTYVEFGRRKLQETTKFYEQAALERQQRLGQHLSQPAAAQFVV